MREPSIPRDVQRYPTAFDQTSSIEVLRRDRLTRDDLENGLAIRPPKADQVISVLRKHETVTVEGPPGSGKSGLAALVNWTLLREGLESYCLRGRDAQNQEVGNLRALLQDLPNEVVIIIDDVHLVPRLLPYLQQFPWAADRSYLLLGRHPYITETSARGEFPRGITAITLDTSDQAYVATELAQMHLTNKQAAALLTRSSGDLVLTKWLLHDAISRSRVAESNPTQLASEKLQELLENVGPGAVRLYLTLAAFGWLEVVCTESFLVKVLGFSLEGLQALLSPLHEAERTKILGDSGDFEWRLKRHPKLSRLYLDCVSELGPIPVDQFVLGPTRKVLHLSDDLDNGAGIEHFVVGAAVVNEVIDLSVIELRLIYAGRSADIVKCIQVVAAIMREHDRARPTRQLVVKEQAHRLAWAFAAANGERRIRGAKAAERLLTDMQHQLRVEQIPDQEFAEKGYILYQDAYLLRLENTGQKALERFEESAKADERWAKSCGSRLHYGKAIMSRIAAAAYRIDMAVLCGSNPTFDPDRTELRLIARMLAEYRDALIGLQPSLESPETRGYLRVFRKNALLHLAEVAGWLGDESVMEQNLTEAADFVGTNESLLLNVALAKGALALTLERYGEVLAIMDGQPEKRALFKAGEGAGKAAVMLIVANQKLGLSSEAEKICKWLEGNSCPEDAGNGLAKNWVSQPPT